MLFRSTRQTTVGVRGVSPEYGVMRSETADAGRFLDAEDVENHRRVAFLGSDVARKIFSNIPPVGQVVRIGGMSFEVVGVMPNKAQLSNYFYPDKLSVFIPYTVFRQIVSQDYVDDFVVQSLNGSVHDRTVRQVREVLAQRHRFDSRDERAVRIDDSGEIVAILGGITNGQIGRASCRERV